MVELLASESRAMSSKPSATNIYLHMLTAVNVPSALLFWLPTNAVCPVVILFCSMVVSTFSLYF